MLISVIIPTKNSGKYISRAIDSVFSQEGTAHFEIIVVDAMSQDRTREIVQSYGGQVFLYDQPLVSQEFPNAGVAVARNYGISQARGEYVAFLDSDDFWFPDKIENQVKLFDQNYDVVMVGSQMLNFYGDGRISPPKLSKSYCGDLFKTFIKRNIIFCSTVLIKSDVLKSIDTPFYSCLDTSEDWHLWIRIAAAHKVIASPMVHGIRFCRENSLAHQMLDDPYRLQSFYRLFDSLIEYPEIKKRSGRFLIRCAKLDYAFRFYFKKGKYLSSFMHGFLFFFCRFLLNR